MSFSSSSCLAQILNLLMMMPCYTRQIHTAAMSNWNTTTVKLLLQSPDAYHALSPKLFSEVKSLSQSIRFQLMAYSTIAVLNDGLLLLEFSDAVREGEGKRILHCWRAILIYFQHAWHTNYAKEAVLLQAAVSATATPPLAVHITWSRTVNTRGGLGNNIHVPVDLHNGHLNHALKTAVAGMGANVAANTILQCGKSHKGSSSEL